MKNKLIAFLCVTAIISIINFIFAFFSTYFKYAPIDLISAVNPLFIPFSLFFQRLVFSSYSSFHYGISPFLIMSFVLWVVGLYINYVIAIKTNIIVLTAKWTGYKPSEKSGQHLLTEKYGILVSFKLVCFLLMIVHTMLIIYYLPKIFMEKAIIVTFIIPLVTYVIGVFSLFCLTKIIDFLFELDKKTDN